MWIARFEGLIQISNQAASSTILIFTLSMPQAVKPTAIR
jgi:hypothetical protein